MKNRINKKRLYRFFQTYRRVPNFKNAKTDEMLEVFDQRYQAIKPVLDYLKDK